MFAKCVYDTGTVSPHAWGWTVRADDRMAAFLGIPTRVGVDLPTVPRHMRVSRYPHTRGGGPASAEVECWMSKVSPHAWGWTVTPKRAASWLIGIPTRVGVDRRWSTTP